MPTPCDSTRQSVLFEEVFSKRVRVNFDAEAQTSDAGVLLVAAADRRLGLTDALVGEVIDPRQPGKVQHDMLELLRQRVYAIALGYEDGVDAARLASDPGLKLACERSPLQGADLASQSTVSRFENMLTGRDVVLMGQCLETRAVEELRRRYPRPGRVVIDLDPSVDPAHGGQQGILFNGYYDTWCYLPIFGFLSVEGGESDHILFCARLRPGTAKEGRGWIPVLRRVVAHLRETYGPRLPILVRLDGGFASPLLLDVLEELRLKYVVGLANNQKLNRWAKRRLPRARAMARKGGRAERVFDERLYQAQSWSHSRRVVLKAEAIPYPGRKLKSNPRFVVTNLRGKPERVYATYCRRGDVENRIKELKRDLSIDRTSCSGFLANQLRVVMTAAAYLLFQDLRWQLRKSEHKRTQVGRLRTVLLKVSARVTESVRRVVFHLPVSYPFAELWAKAARAVGATRPAPAP